MGMVISGPHRPGTVPAPLDDVGPTTFRMLREGAREFARIGVFVLGPVLLVHGLLGAAMVRLVVDHRSRLLPGAYDPSWLLAAPYLAGIGLASMVGMVLTQGGVTYAVLARLAGRPSEPCAAIRVGAARFPSLLAQHLLVSLLVLAGLALFVVPGLLALAVYFLVFGVAGPAVVAEDLSALEGLDASTDLTRGRRLAIAGAWLGLLVVLAVVVAGFGAVAFAVAAPLVEPHAGEPSISLGAWVASVGVGAGQWVYTIVASAFWAVVYARLREHTAA